MPEGNEQLKSLLEYLEETQKPIYHTPVDLGINEFKKVVRSTALPKTSQNKLIKGYKRRAWMEWTGVSKLRGTFPTHPVYGKKIKVKRGPRFEWDIEVKVNE